MSLRGRILILLFAALIPVGIVAQEKKGDIDFNIGISTPGVYSLADIDLFEPVYSYYDYMNKDNLGDLQTNSYNSSIYPSVSAEITYKLADSGFFKRLSLAGYVGFHMADYQKIDIASDSKGNMETAMKLDLLLGIRYNIINARYFNMYTQAFIGGEIKNGSEYWNVPYEKFFPNDSNIRGHLTFLGFRFKLGQSNWGLMTELGYGSEYCSSYIPAIPGIRGAVSYRF